MERRSLPMPDALPLSGRRVVIYGAERPLGSALLRLLRAGGAQAGVASARTDGASLFALKRAAAADAPAEAADLANPTSVQVATRKLARALGGLDLAVVAAAPDDAPDAVIGALRSALREIRRGRRAGTAVLLAVAPAAPLLLAAVGRLAAATDPALARVGVLLVGSTLDGLPLVLHDLADGEAPLHGQITTLALGQGTRVALPVDGEPAEGAP